MEDLRLELYVSGGDPGSELAEQRVRRIFGSALEVIDVQADPERAARAECFVTPTLVRSRPAPERRLIGDLSDDRAVMAALGLEREA